MDRDFYAFYYFILEVSCVVSIVRSLVSKHQCCTTRDVATRKVKAAGQPYDIRIHDVLGECRSGEGTV